MPDSILPSELKNIKTFGVLVTKTTEEDVEMALAKAYIEYLRLKEDFLANASSEYGKYLDGNPYNDHDFKTPLEELIIPWLKNKSQYFVKIVHLRNDFSLCAKHLKKEYPQIEDLENFINQMLTYNKDYELLDKMYRRDAYLNWRDKKAQLKKDDMKKNPHKYHMSIQDWDDLIARDPDANKMLDGPEKYKEVMACPLCIEVEVKRIEKMTERDNIPARIEENVEDYKECDICEFIGKSYAFERHFEHTQHLTAVHLRNLYCEKCETQCRTEKELQTHNKSSKHIKLNSEKVTITYSCEKCNYSTLFKQVYENHCKTKKHNS